MSTALAKKTKNSYPYPRERKKTVSSPFVRIIAGVRRLSIDRTEGRSSAW
jgi:hypothetical protein